ncbi:NADH-quinone oxidoreductase subunit J [Edaphobacter acidisoli]|uniref:NADH-quinone oxidoreductase subunit J n=1 Tax=Edaphobacter acidisoli TaxID=2040573 RepID=A0A916RRG4_9BACT|nr:NADH-quinone oxidoreductase subunit J [Edaphobacter acidisoli]GGA65496.1 NADH-quinone oxidoreductase subunit J [Edaphobacter acidisoli]
MLFTIFAILTVAGAVAAFSLRNLIHSVLAITVAFAGLAVVYLLLGAQFIGLAQILVYVGAVVILIVFAVLLTKNSSTPAGPILSSSWLASGAIALAVFAVMAWAIHQSPASRIHTPTQPEATMQQIGSALMLRYALPLEIVGLLLTTALIGAVTIAVREQKEQR